MEGNIMITAEQKKDIDCAVDVIIRNCRSGHQPHLSKGMAYEQLRGLMIGLRFLVHIDQDPTKSVGDFTSCKLEDEYQALIDREM
jgi:hypothetical protein